MRPSPRRKSQRGTSRSAGPDWPSNNLPMSDAGVLSMELRAMSFERTIRGCSKLDSTSCLLTCYRALNKWQLVSECPALRRPVLHVRRSRFPGAVGTTEKPAADFDAMPDHLAVTVFANRCDRLDRAFEAVEYMPLSGGDQLKALVVIVAANFAFGHVVLHRAGRGIRMYRLP